MTRRTRPDQWPESAHLVLATVYPYFAAPLVARALGRSARAVRQKASELGIRKSARGRSNAAKWAQGRRRNNDGAMRREGK